MSAAAEDPLAERQAHARMILWLCAHYVMSSIEIAKVAHGGDAMRAMIFTAIWSANVSHTRTSRTPQAGLVSDGLRRPVTIARIARLVGAPEETVRRHVVRLLADGLCVREGRKGVVVKRDVFLRAEMIDAAEKQIEAAKRHYRSLTPLLGL